MQHARPSPTMCNCTSETLRIMKTIQQTAAPAPTTMTTTSSSSRPAVALGDVLCAGRLLVRNWERINGCAQAGLHLDAALLRDVADATNSIVGLYEAAGVAAAVATTTDAPSPPVRLGTHLLDADEAALVHREAMRHSLLLLGEVLNDIEKDLGDVQAPPAEPRVDDVRAGVRQATARLLRTLGRVNRTASGVC